jgi:DNA-binding GntR family transcriptional regulator
MTGAAGGELVRSLRGQIVDQLRNDVLAGRIQQGTFLRQEDLVARFRVSRTPVREALIQLTNEGLLEAIPNTGVKVRHQPPDHVQAFLTPLRRTIEVYALQLCFDKLNADDFRRWDGILDNLRKACADRDYPNMAQNEIEFHRSIVHRSGEPTLMGIWSLILSQVAAQFRDSYTKYDDPMDVYREHVAIVDKFRTGNLEASIKLYTKMIGAPAPKHPEKTKSKAASKGKK